MVLTPCFVIIGEYFKKRRARAMSLAMLGGSLGGMSLPPLLNYLFSQYNYTGTMLIMSGLLFNLCVAGSLFRGLKKKQKRGRPIPVDDSVVFTGAADMSRDTVSSQKEMEDCGRSLQESEVLQIVVPRIVVDDDDGDAINYGGEGNDEMQTGVRTLSNTSLRLVDDLESDDALTLPAVTKFMSRQVSFQIDGNVLPLDSTPVRHRKTRQRRTVLYNCHRLIASCGLHLFKQSRFTFYCLLMMGSVLSLSISGVFLSGLVQDLGLQRQQTSFLISASSVMDIPSKFASGFVFDMKKARPYRLLLLAALGFMTGICTLTLGFSAGFVDLFIVYMLYTFFASAYHTQHATVLADIVGTPNLSGAMGLCRLSQGIGFILGPTIGGKHIYATLKIGRGVIDAMHGFYDQPQYLFHVYENKYNLNIK